MDYHEVVWRWSMRIAAEADQNTMIVTCIVRGMHVSMTWALAIALLIINVRCTRVALVAYKNTESGIPRFILCVAHVVN